MTRRTLTYTRKARTISGRANELLIINRTIALAEKLGMSVVVKKEASK